MSLSKEELLYIIKNRDCYYQGNCITHRQVKRKEVDITVNELQMVICQLRGKECPNVYPEGEEYKGQMTISPRMRLERNPDFIRIVTDIYVGTYGQESLFEELL